MTRSDEHPCVAARGRHSGAGSPDRYATRRSHRRSRAISTTASDGAVAAAISTESGLRQHRCYLDSSRDGGLLSEPSAKPQTVRSYLERERFPEEMGMPTHMPRVLSCAAGGERRADPLAVQRQRGNALSITPPH